MKRFFYSFILILMATSEPGWSAFSCEEQLRLVAVKSSYLIGMAGNASGSTLAGKTAALGFQTLHLRFKAVDPDVDKTFPGSDIFAQQWSVEGTHELPEVAHQIARFAQQSGRPLRGASPGMDLAVYSVDFLSAAFGLQANSVELGDWRSNKGKVHEAMQAAGLPTPNTQFFQTPEELQRQAEFLPYPLLAKPVSGSGSVGAGSFFSANALRQGLAPLVEENRKRQNHDRGLLVQELLQPAGYIPFVNTVSYRQKDGTVRRVVTGVWEDVRGEDFPKEVWDAIYLCPSEKYLSSDRLRFFQTIREADRKTLRALGAEVGVTHNEYMGNPHRLIDPNWRLPGLDSPSLEALATGMNPYHMEIASRVLPSVLDEYPDVYTFKGQIQPALVFIRSHHDGEVTEKGVEWLEQRLKLGQKWLATWNAGNFDSPEQTVIIRRGGKKAHASAYMTKNGRTLVEWLQVVGPDRESVEAFVRDVRQKERENFFVQPSN